MRDHAISEDDQATEQEMWATDLAIRAVRSRRDELQPIGQCHNCLGIVEHPKKFCDSECATDFHKRMRQ